MQSCRSSIGVAAVLALVTASVASAGQQGGAATVYPPRANAVLIPGTRAAALRDLVRIIGTARSATDSPIPRARVRLRSVALGSVSSAATANDSGEFVFAQIEPGTYIIELLDEAGRVLAINYVSAASGEKVATYVRLPFRGSGPTGLFTTTAATVVTAASSFGILAVAATGRPASQER